jgi:hypothetical protein
VSRRGPAAIEAAYLEMARNLVAEARPGSRGLIDHAPARRHAPVA